ncbi:hypothetical protein F8M41_011989 [Gigaspora margarita]|uniref:Uncharacterized protein n=1 Tax=Gigaspora margarita TaxID=4874 RepID=A0A8H4EPQ2_GIGMA|nr:hypothetical protein F8M41_011989 [Gigaspora margarita]
MDPLQEVVETQLEFIDRLKFTILEDFHTESEELSQGVDSSNQIETEGNTTISIKIDNHHMTNKEVKEITEVEKEGR